MKGEDSTFKERRSIDFNDSGRCTRERETKEKEEEREKGGDSTFKKRRSIDLNDSGRHREREKERVVKLEVF